jgi:hypothetical protein
VTVPLRDHDAGGNVFVDEDAGVASDVEVENGPRPSLIRYMDSLGGYSFRLATNTVMIKSGNLE